MGILSRLFHPGTTTDVLDLLKAQHEEVDHLFEQLAKREGNRRALFTELADKLAAHATVEEEIFYPFVMSKATNDLLHEGVEEHLAIKRVLADLITMDLDDEAFTAKLHVLKEQVEHHAHKEEEDKLFPRVRELLSADERAGLGNEVLSRFEDLMKSHPYKNIPTETDEAATLPRR
jgi:hemerythrin superfamily protein